jgi:CRP-like cAMP-binding protein
MPASPTSLGSDENKVLAALGKLQSQHFCSQAERVSVTQGEVIYEPDAQIKYVYFPETAVFSMLATMEDGSTVEVGPVGDEGLVGLRVYLGASTSLNMVIVHVAGSAMRVSVDVFTKELCAGQSAMARLLQRYTQMLLAMTSQSAACYKLHSLEPQLARWLLMMHDYAGGDDLRLTHELMALTLGVRRAGVSTAANEFRNAGIIDYRRGHIQLHDRRGLQARACECYQVIKTEYERLYADLPKLAT